LQFNFCPSIPENPEKAIIAIYVAINFDHDILQNTTSLASDDEKMFREGDL